MDREWPSFRHLGDVTLDELAVFNNRKVLVLLERIEHKLDVILEKVSPDN